MWLFNSDIEVLSNVITKPPLFIPDHTIKWTLHIVLVASSSSAGARITNHCGPANTTTGALVPLPEPASFALGTRSVGIRCHRCSILVPIAVDKRWVCT